MSPTFDPTSAFLGPNLWSSADYTDGDISLEYMDLDEFLSENGIPVDLNEASNGSSKSNDSQVSSPKESDSAPTSTVNIKEIQSPQEDDMEDSDSDEESCEEGIYISYICEHHVTGTYVNIMWQDHLWTSCD